MTIVSLFMVHRSPFSVSRLADFFSILLWGRPENAATLIGQLYGKPIVGREGQFPIPIAARQHQTHLAIFIET